MAVVKETAQVDVIVNGTPAKATIKDLEAEYKKLNIQIKNLEIGSEAYNQKLKQLGATGAALKAQREEIKKSQDEASGLADRLSKLDGGGGVFSRLKQGFTDTKESISGAVNGLSIFQLGMVGIIAAAAALIGYSLYSYFTKTDEGATKLEGALGGLRAGLNRLVAGFVTAGEWIVKAFTEPKEALNDFVKFLKDQVEVRIQAVVRMFKALGTILSSDVKKGYDDLRNAQIDFATGVENTTKKISEFAKEVADAAKVAYDLALATDALEDAEQRYSITAAKREVLVDKLILQSKNQQRTEKERKELLDAASLTEIADYNEKNRLATEALKIEKERTNQKLKEIGITDEQIKQADTLEARLDLIQRLAGDGPKAEIDALNKLTKLEGESIAVQEKINNRRSALDEELAKEREKKAEEERKRQEKHAKDVEQFTALELAAYRRTQDLQISLIEDTYEQRREMARVAASREIEDSKASAEQKAILEAQLQVKLNEQIALIDREQREKRLKENLDDIDLATETKEAALQLQYASAIGKEEEYQALLYQIKLGALEKELQLLKDSGVADEDEIRRKENEIIRLKAEGQKKQTESEKKGAEDRKKIRDAELQSTRTAVQGLMGLIEDLAGENAKSTLLYKAFATADVVLNGILEVQRIFASYSTLGPVGQALAVVNAGIAVARTGVAVSKIASVQAPQKSGRLGMILDGPSHGSSYGRSGIAMINRNTGAEVGEVEGDEIVLTRGVTYNPTLRRMASQINQAGGGRSLYADGGQLGDGPRDFIGQGSSAVNTLIEQNERMIALQSAQKTTLTAEVSLTEFSEKTTLKDTIDAKANA